MVDHDSGTASAIRWPCAQLFILLACAFLCGAATAATSVPHVRPKVHVVTIEGMRFNPQVLTVHRGDRVVWVNKDLFPHTATAATGAFNSQSVAPNGSWNFVTQQSGDFAYGCTFHPTMTARLTVK